MDASDINIGHDDIKVQSESDENAELIMCKFCSKIFDTEKNLGIYKKDFHDLIKSDDHFSKLICV